MGPESLQCELGYAISYHMSLLQEIKEMTYLGEGTWLHKCLRNAGSYLTINPPIVEVDSISYEYIPFLDIGTAFWGLENWSFLWI